MRGSRETSSRTKEPKRALGRVVLLFVVLSGLRYNTVLLSNLASIESKKNGTRIDDVGPHRDEVTSAISNGSVQEYAVYPEHSSDDKKDTNFFDANVTSGLQQPGGTDVPAPGPRISYRLVRNRPSTDLYNEYKCFRRQRGELAVELQGHGVVDFFPEVTATNHTALVVGDSIAIQIAQSMEYAWGVQPENRLVDVLNPSSRTVSWPARGGGALVQYRYPYLFNQRSATDQKRRRLNPSMWNRTHMEQTLELLPIPTASTRGGVDVVVQRITHPWISFDSITHEALRENTEIVADVFQTPTLIYVNLIFNNNIITQHDYEHLVEKRELVRTFARSRYDIPANGTLRRIMVLDMDVFSDQLNECHARGIGFNTSAPYEEWMLSHLLKKPFTRGYAWHVAHVCSERVPDLTPKCRLNLISVDGMHVCPSTVLGRVTAGLACLMACADRDDEGVGEGRQTNFDLRKCEQQCNRKFMSLVPIPPAELVEWDGSSAS